MPTVKDATGEVVAKLPYDAKGEAQAEAMVQQDPSLKIDYAPGGQYDAPDMRESYQLGGQIPGQPGFGERPQPIAPKPINPGMNPLEIEPVTPSVSIPPLYKKGGKVDKYTKK